MPSKSPITVQDLHPEDFLKKLEAVDHKSTWNHQEQILQKDDVWGHEFTNRQWAPKRRCNMHDQKLNDSGETFGGSWDILDKRILVLLVDHDSSQSSRKHMGHFANEVVLCSLSQAEFWTGDMQSRRSLYTRLYNFMHCKAHRGLHTMFSK